MNGNKPRLVNINEYLVSLLPIAAATLALALQLWTWPEEWDNNLQKGTAIAAVLIFLALTQYGLMHWRARVVSRSLALLCLRKMLDLIIKREEVDPTGTLNARANVMRPHNQPAAW